MKSAANVSKMIRRGLLDNREPLAVCPQFDEKQVEFEALPC